MCLVDDSVICVNFMLHTGPEVQYVYVLPNQIVSVKSRLVNPFCKNENEQKRNISTVLLTEYTILLFIQLFMLYLQYECTGLHVVLK